MTSLTRRTCITTLATGILAMAGNGWAQDAQTPVAPQATSIQARLVDTLGMPAREVAGTLTVDDATRVVRFTHGDQILFEIDYGTITALHVERSSFPQRAWRRSSDYCTIESGDRRLSIRALSLDELEPVLTALERVTGLRADRSSSLRQGVPALAAAPPQTAPLATFQSLATQVSAGDTVYVEAAASGGGYDSLKDRVVRVSPDTLVLAGLGAVEKSRVLAVWTRETPRGTRAVKGFFIGLAVGVAFDRLLAAAWAGQQDFTGADFKFVAVSGAIGAVGGAAGPSHDRFLFRAPAIRF